MNPFWHNFPHLPTLVFCLGVAGLGLAWRYTLARRQTARRGLSRGGRRLPIPDILAEVDVNSVYHRVVMPVIRENSTAAELRRLLANEDVLFPLTVVDAAGKPAGILTMGGIRPVYFDDAQHKLFLVKDMATPLVTCAPQDSLASVLRKFEESNYSRIPVVSRDRDGDLLGYIQYQDIMVAYETELARRRRT